MGVLLYCAAPAGVDSNGLAGVGQSAVDSVLANTVRFFFSDHETAEPLDESWKTRALEFHAALDSMFQQATIIPFRFPTLLRSRDELHDFVGRSADAFSMELERLNGKAQMEVVLESLPESTDTPSSGTAYLQSRQSRAREQEALVKKLREIAGDLALETEAISSAGRLRICFLVLRERVQEFAQRMQIDRSYRVTGPWPPSAFVSRDLLAEEVRRG